MHNKATFHSNYFSLRFFLFFHEILINLTIHKKMISRKHTEKILFAKKDEVINIKRSLKP